MASGAGRVIRGRGTHRLSPLDKRDDDLPRGRSRFGLRSRKRRVPEQHRCANPPGIRAGDGVRDPLRGVGLRRVFCRGGTCLGAGQRLPSLWPKATRKRLQALDPRMAEIVGSLFGEIDAKYALEGEQMCLELSA